VIFFVIFKVVDSSIILSDGTTSYTSKNDFSNKDILCHGHVLSALCNNIYKIFCHIKPSVKSWETLKLKYGSALTFFEKMIEF